MLLIIRLDLVRKCTNNFKYFFNIFLKNLGKNQPTVWSDDAQVRE